MAQLQGAVVRNSRSQCRGLKLLRAILHTPSSSAAWSLGAKRLRQLINMFPKCWRIFGKCPHYVLYPNHSTKFTYLLETSDPETTVPGDRFRKRVNNCAVK